LGKGKPKKREKKRYTFRIFLTRIPKCTLAENQKGKGRKLSWFSPSIEGGKGGEKKKPADPCSKE